MVEADGNLVLNTESSWCGLVCDWKEHKPLAIWKSMLVSQDYSGGFLWTISNGQDIDLLDQPWICTCAVNSMPIPINMDNCIEGFKVADMLTELNT